MEWGANAKTEPVLQPPTGRHQPKNLAGTGPRTGVSGQVPSQCTPKAVGVLLQILLRVRFLISCHHKSCRAEGTSSIELCLSMSVARLTQGDVSLLSPCSRFLFWFVTAVSASELHGG